MWISKKEYDKLLDAYETWNSICNAAEDEDNVVACVSYNLMLVSTSILKKYENQKKEYESQIKSYNEMYDELKRNSQADIEFWKHQYIKVREELEQLKET